MVILYSQISKGKNLLNISTVLNIYHQQPLRSYLNLPIDKMSLQHTRRRVSFHPTSAKTTILARWKPKLCHVKEIWMWMVAHFPTDSSYETVIRRTASPSCSPSFILSITFEVKLKGSLFVRSISIYGYCGPLGWRRKVMMRKMKLMGYKGIHVKKWKIMILDLSGN